MTLDCDLLFPGHGPPILGKERIRRACHETASFLEKLVKPCLRMMNSGFTLNEIQHMMECPEWNPKTQIFLQQNYDDWRFVIVNVWRLYAGSWDQDPAHLLPPDEAKLARVVSKLAGGSDALIKMASELRRHGELKVATSLCQWAAHVSPRDKAVHELRASVYEERAENESTLMAQSIFYDAAEQSHRALRGETWARSLGARRMSENRL